MNRRARKQIAVVVLALSLSLQAPAAFAAPRTRGDGPGVIDRIVRIIKHVVKGLTPGVLDDTNIAWPTPPKP